MNETLDQYRALLGKVDSFFAQVRARHESSFACRRGCHSCCKPNLTVNALEAENIRLGLAGDGARLNRLRGLESVDPFLGLRCSFLEADGACGIYELRPVVCRSHGLALEFKDFGEGEDMVIFRDVCALNFTNSEIESLESSDVLNLDTLNTVLAALNHRHGAGETRTELKVSAILGSPSA